MEEFFYSGMKGLLVVVLVLALYVMSYPKNPLEIVSYLTCKSGLGFCPDIRISGHNSELFQPVRDQFVQNYQNLEERHSQLVVYHKGNVVVDLTGKSCYYNCSNDPYDRESIQTVFSTTKVVTSIVIAMLVDRNILQYEGKIASYWPEFAQNGKENITIQQLMQHAAGLSFIDDRDPSTNDLLPLFSEKDSYLDDMARIIERAVPHYSKPYETKTAYHGITRGLILNEIVRRADPKKRTIGRFVQEEIAQPLGVDYHIGVRNNLSGKDIAELPIMPHQSDSFGWRLYVVGKLFIKFVFGDLLGLIDGVPTVPHNLTRFMIDDVLTGNLFSCPLIRSAETIEGALAISITESFNTDHSRIIESPSSNGLSNAWSMAKIMNSLLHSEDLLSRKTFKKLIHDTGKPEYDLGIHSYVIYTDGGWAHFHQDFASFEGFYGWSGIGGATMLLDPENDTVVAYSTSRIKTLSPWDDPRTQNLLRVIKQVIN